MARPKKPIIWELVERKMEAGCTAREIAASFCINIDTFYDRFKEEYGHAFSDFSDEYFYAGIGNLKYVQYTRALKGNTQMLILLGKEHLGQGKEQVQKYSNEELLEISHQNMILRNEIAKLREMVNAQGSSENKSSSQDNNEPKTG